MKKTLLLIVFTFLSISFGYSQTDKAWKTFNGGDVKVALTAERQSFPQDYTLMQLDLAALKQVLNTATDRFAENKKSAIISIPNSDGKIERYRIHEASNFDDELQAQFPEIRSYVGQGIDDKYAGSIVIDDTIKDDAKSTIAKLKNLGLTTAMLTGDNERCAQKVAHELGIKHFFAEVLPDGKAEAIIRPSVEMRADASTSADELFKSSKIC